MPATPTSRPRRHLLGFAVAVAVAVAATPMLLVSATAHADPPPWQQSGNVNNDPNRVGTLAFHDATGAEIFSGNTADLPLAAYVVGSDGLRSGDTLAALYAYLPNAATPAGGWTGSLLTAATTYPNGSAPGALAAAGPLQSGSASDVSLTDFIAGHPNTSDVAAYRGVYELRLRTSAEGRVPTTTYDAADIVVSGATWQVVYPGHFTDTATSLAVTPNTGLHAGASVTLTATVDHNDATGTVHFTDGSAALGTDVAVSGGTASKTVKIATAGSHTFHATYSGDSTYAGSTGSSALTFGQAVTRTTATWPSTTLRYGSGWTVKATVTAPGTVPTGTVSLKYATTVLKSGPLSAGKVSLTIPGKALVPGSRAVVLRYNGSANAVPSQTGKTLTIGKAIAHVTTKLVLATVRTTVHAKLAVHVTAIGTVPAGTVYVYDGTTKIAIGKLSNGAVTVTLPLLTRLGKHSIHTKYLGSSLVTSAGAAPVTLTVTR